MGVQKHYIGETFTAYNGMKFTIINIDKASKKPYTIQFEDGYITNIVVDYLKNGAHIRNNRLSNPRKIDRTGEQNRHKDGSLMTIIEYTNADNILVKFDDSSICKSKYSNFANGTCIHKIRIFEKYYDSVNSICKHFKISPITIKNKSNAEVEEYIINNRIEHNGQWMTIYDYVKAHKVLPSNFYKYLIDNNIEKNAANVKRYITHYLDVTEDKIDATITSENTLKIINNYFGTYFKSLNSIVHYFDLNSYNTHTYISVGEDPIEYIKQHAIRYKDQWISIKSYCEKISIEYNSLIIWAKTKSISINASNIAEAIKSYSNDITIEAEKQKIYEMQKLKQLIKRYNISATRNTANIYRYFNCNNLSAEQVIVHFRPDLHINIFGKIVDENGNEV